MGLFFEVLEESNSRVWKIWSSFSPRAPLPKFGILGKGRRIAEASRSGIVAEVVAELQQQHPRLCGDL